MNSLIIDIYQELLNEHINQQTKYSTYNFKSMKLNKFIDNFRIMYKDNPVIDYFNENLIIQKIFKKHYLSNGLLYDNIDIINFFFHLDEYYDEIIKESRLLKINKLLQL